MDVWYLPSVLAWIEDLLCERFGLKLSVRALANDRLVISLPGSNQLIELPAMGSVFTRRTSSLPCASWPGVIEGWRMPTESFLPAPGADALPTPLITSTPDGWHIAYDILGLTYWALCRIEEIGRTDLDGHGRFPAKASHAYRHGYLERPIVDEWLDILGQVMVRNWPGLVLKQHDFSIKVSHDVDHPSRYGFCSIGSLARRMSRDVLKLKGVKGAVLAPCVRVRTRNRLHPADSFNTFDWIMDQSEQRNLVSAFYFICSHTDPRDGEYRLGHPAIRDLLRRIYERGHEIGLHPGYGSFQDPALIAAQAEQLREVMAEENIHQSILGGRMHFLRWEHPTTLQAWADAGMTYDSTLGYADHVGFRCGTCFEYQSFNPVTQQVLPLRMRPLVAMEWTVMAPGYMGLGTGRGAYVVLERLKKTCRAVNGNFTLLWHNSMFETTAQRSLYVSLLTTEARYMIGEMPQSTILKS